MGSDVARLTLCVFSPSGHQVHVAINSSRPLIYMIAGHLVVLIMQNSTIAALVLYRLYFFVRMAAAAARSDIECQFLMVITNYLLTATQFR